MASTLTLNGAQAAVICNLDTYNYTVNTTAAHVCKINLLVIPPSGILILIKQNGSTIATMSAAHDAEVNNLITTAACTSGDVISFVLSSAVQVDNNLNVLKGIINIHVGSLN